MPAVRRAAPLVLAAFLLAAFLAGCATAGSLVFPSEPKPGTVFHSFIKPDGPGPFPAVVLLHTCGGVGRHMPGWAARLQSIGYASVIVDSFTPRGGTACSIPMYFPATLDQVTEDAFAALAWLRGRSDIDSERIGVMGFSYGASATLRTSSAQYRKHAPGGGFRAAAAYYPVCVNPRADWPAAAQQRSNNLFDDIATPTLILVGADDADTPNVAQNCVDKVAQLARQGRPITIHMYPNADHVFDIRQPVAAAKAFADLQAFFARYLGRAAITLAATGVVNAQQPAQPAAPAEVVKDIPAESKVYVGTFRFKTSVDEGKFWISYDGAALKLERFSYKDAKGERDLKEVKIVRAESGPGYTIVGKTWQIKNLVPEKDGKLLVGDFERGTFKNRINYWREKE